MSDEHCHMGRADPTGVWVRPGWTYQVHTATRKTRRTDGFCQRFSAEYRPADRPAGSVRSYRGDLARVNRHLALAYARSGWRSHPGDGGRDAYPHTTPRIFL